MQIATKTVIKEWGSELWLANNKEHDYCGKILTINPGCSTSLHFHANKHETFYVIEGELELVTVDTHLFGTLPGLYLFGSDLHLSHRHG